MCSEPSKLGAEKEDGVFTCQQCGDCCKGYGGTYVSEADIRRIAAFIEVEPGVIYKRYCQKSGDRQLLAQGRDGFCIFYREGCSIHAVKPKMCRDWPYIRSLQVDFKNWQAMASMCPGINTNAAASVVMDRVNALQSKNKS